MITKRCQYCGKEFESYESTNRKFCSYKCTYASRKTGSWKSCLVCSKKFWNCKSESKKFCSKHCHNKSKIKLIIKHCLTCGKEFKTIPYRIKHNEGKYCCRKCWYKSRIGVEKSESTKEKIKEAHKRKQFGFQKGLIPKNKFKNRYLISLKARIRTKDIYKLWRLNVIKQDNWQCDCCCIKRNKNNPMIAHHLKSFSIILKDNNIKTIDEAYNCKELWNTNNGITLCEKCHLVFHKIYGNGNNTKKQYLEFKSYFLLISSLANLLLQIPLNQSCSDNKVAKIY